MLEALRDIVKQPYWVIALIVGVVLVAGPCVTMDKEHSWSTHPPTSYWPIGVGIALVIVSASAFLLNGWLVERSANRNASVGLDFSRVSEREGEVWATVGGCEIRVAQGRIESYIRPEGCAVALPCNEYFDDECVDDRRTALGAFVNQVFEGQVDQFATLIRTESRNRLAPGTTQQKTNDVEAESFGAGKCVLLVEPLGRLVSIALVSTTTQRAGQGLSARISYLFDGMQEMTAQLADKRINEVVMPILGAGHGGIDPSMALVGLLLALAEAARYGQGSQRMKRVTVVVYKSDTDTPPVVDPLVIRRSLALIAAE
jgi:hypothetical protein